MQIWSLWLAFTFLNENVTFGVFVALSAIEVLFIFNRRGNSAYKLSWIVPIILFPVFGGLFYLFLKLQSTVKKMRHSYGEEERIMRAALRSEAERHRASPVSGAKDPAFSGIVSYLGDTCGFPAYQNSSVQFFPLGDAAFPVLFSELRKAERFIFLEFFIVAQGEIWDEVLAILKEKAREGVEIRFLYDGMNAISNLPFRYDEELVRFGIDTKVFSPVVPVLASYQNNRDHRKICVIDGTTAFTGGFNLADEYANRIVRFGHWKDTAVMVKGEAVSSFSAMFLQMWNCAYRNGRREQEKLPYARYLFSACARAEHAPDVSCAGLVIPYGDNPLDEESVGENVYLDLLYAAREYVHIMTPYLVLDDQMMNALCFAAKRGVDVRILFPGIPDKPYAFWLAHSYYPELLRSGVRIFEYMPGFVHAKEFIVDGKRAVVGTINLDFRSLYLHFENAVYFQDAPDIAGMEADFQSCLSVCTEINEAVLAGAPWYKTFFGSILRIFAPLF